MVTLSKQRRYVSVSSLFMACPPSRELGPKEVGRQVTSILVDDQGRARGVEHEAAGEQGGDSDRQQDFAPSSSAMLCRTCWPRACLRRCGKTSWLPIPTGPYLPRYFSISLGFNRSPREFGVNQYSTIVYPDWMTRLSDVPFSASLLTDLPGERLPKLRRYRCGAESRGNFPGQHWRDRPPGELEWPE
jgi:hypothetical protein